MAASSSFYALLDTTGRVQSHNKHTWSESEIVLPQRPSWQQEASCRGMGPDLFYSHLPADIAQAVAICAECPVTVQCAAYRAEHDDIHGTWGRVSIPE